MRIIIFTQNFILSDGEEERNPKRFVFMKANIFLPRMIRDVKRLTSHSNEVRRGQVNNTRSASADRRENEKNLLNA